MPDYNKCNSRLESLVVETKTYWAADVGELSPEQKARIAAALHKHPENASNICYERTHTGFTRVITVTAADVERLKQET